MTSLPKAARITLSEAVRFVARQSGVSANKARDAIKDAGIAKLIDAFGLCPLNAHLDLTIATKLAGARMSEQKLDPSDWKAINWKTETSGRISSICVSTVGLESWFFTIDSASHSTAPQPLSMASDELIREQLRSLYDEPNQKPPNLAEVSSLIRDRLKPLGKKATQEKIRSIAEEEEFKCRRRPAGRTLLADRNIVNLSKPQV